MKRGIFTTMSGAITAAVAKAQATADNARQMVLNRDVTLKDLQADAATIPDIINAAATEHAQINEAWQAADAALSSRIDHISLTPGPAGRDGKDGRDGLNGTNGVNGIPGSNGADGASAYQLARAAGYGGTQTQWLASLKGADGAKGDTGPTGPAGAPNLQIEYRDGVAVPAVLSLLGLSATVDVTITWPTPFPDAAYVVTPQVATSAAGLIGKTTATLKSKTATGCVVTVTTTALISAGAATLSAVAYRKS